MLLRTISIEDGDQKALTAALLCSFAIPDLNRSFLAYSLNEEVDGDNLRIYIASISMAGNTCTLGGLSSEHDCQSATRVFKQILQEAATGERLATDVPYYPLDLTKQTVAPAVLTEHHTLTAKKTGVVKLFTFTPSVDYGPLLESATTVFSGNSEGVSSTVQAQALANSQAVQGMDEPERIPVQRNRTDGGDTDNEHKPHASADGFSEEQVDGCAMAITDQVETEISVRPANEETAQENLDSHMSFSEEDLELDMSSVSISLDLSNESSPAHSEVSAIECNDAEHFLDVVETTFTEFSNMAEKLTQQKHEAMVQHESLTSREYQLQEKEHRLFQKEEHLKSLEEELLRDREAIANVAELREKQHARETELDMREEKLRRENKELLEKLRKLNSTREKLVTIVKNLNERMQLNADRQAIADAVLSSESS